MNVERDLVRWLEDDGWLGSLADDRIYVDVLPDDVTQPSLRYLVLFQSPIGGAHLQTRVQVDAFAADVETANLMRNALVAIVQSRPDCNLIGARALPWLSASKLYRRMVEFYIYHKSEE